MLQSVQIKDIRHSESVDRYKAPNLFPEAGKFPRVNQRFDYIRGILASLAVERKLFLTDIFNQPQELMDLAGMICLGQRYEIDGSGPMKQIVDPFGVIPAEMTQYPVHIKSLNGKTISWDKGPEEIKQRNWVWRGQGSSMDAKVPILEMVQAETGLTDCELHVYHAWLCLKQHGQYCAVAKTEEERKRLWWYEEVKPDFSSDEKKKK